MKMDKMVSKKLVLGIWMLIALLALTGSVVPLGRLAWADTIQCAGIDVCKGTDNDDTMVGDDTQNIMIGFGGNDVMTGKGGSDLLSAFPGDDVVSGGKGFDNIAGDTGADRMAGGDGNDKIAHFTFGNNPNALDPDGSKDVIDCGLGDDEAWINVSVDHDTASGSEIVHAG
jgi:Ca2+-binding RTX toxin-like protein